MAITSVCPTCWAKVKTPDAAAGATVHCPKCDMTMVIGPKPDPLLAKVSPEVRQSLASNERLLAVKRINPKILFLPSVGVFVGTLLGLIGTCVRGRATWI